MPKGLKEQAKKARKTLRRRVDSVAYHTMGAYFTARDLMGDMIKGKEKEDTRPPFEQLEDMAVRTVLFVPEPGKYDKALNLLREMEVEDLQAYITEERWKEDYLVHKNIGPMLLILSAGLGDKEKFSIVMNTKEFALGNKAMEGMTSDDKAPDDELLDNEVLYRALERTIILGHNEITAAILATGVPLNKLQFMRHSALVLACEQGNFELAHMLMDFGAVGIKETTFYGSPLHSLFYYADTRDSTMDDLEPFVSSGTEFFEGTESSEEAYTAVSVPFPDFDAENESVKKTLEEPNSEWLQLMQRLLYEGVMMQLEDNTKNKVIEHIEEKKLFSWEGVVFLDKEHPEIAAKAKSEGAITSLEELLPAFEEGRMTPIAAWNVAQVLRLLADKMHEEYRAGKFSDGSINSSAPGEAAYRTVADNLQESVREHIRLAPYTELPPVLKMEKEKLYDLTEGAALAFSNSKSMPLPYEVGYYMTQYLDDWDKAGLRTACRPVPIEADEAEKAGYTARFRAPEKPENKTQLRRQYYAVAIEKERQMKEVSGGMAL